MPIDSQVEVKQVRLVKGTGAQIAAARQAQEILETDLVVQTDAPDLVTANTAITGATKCKITYDSKGLVTAGADLASSDITTALGYTPYNSTNPNGYQANVIETVKVNGTALTPSSKAVDITVPTNNNQLTNGAGYITSSALSGYQTTITGGATTITSSNLTTSRALISNSSGKVAVSTTTSTELGYVHGVTSAIQTQLNGKQAKIGAGTANNIVAYSGTAGTLNTLTRTTSVRAKASASDTYIPTEKAVATSLEGKYDASNPAGYTSNVGTVTSVNNVSPVNGNVTLSIPTQVTESTVSGWGFTKNTGTVTSVNNVSPVNGNVTLSIPSIDNLANKDLSNLSTTGNSKFQAPLVSGTNIKTINNTTILGSGNISVESLPSQSGQSGKYLTTNGTTASWGVPKTFNLFDNKWSDYELNDQNWLKADTFSWQDGTVYSDAYNHLVVDMTSGAGAELKTETIGSYTVSYYLAADGHKIVMPDQETTVSNIYNESGVAWYYVLDQTNQRFKLPRTKYNFVGFRDTVGKYVESGLPNITGTYIGNSIFKGTSQDNTTVTGAFKRRTDLTSKNVNQSSLSGSTTVGIGFDASLSNSIYGNSETVQPPSTQMYLYFYVGEYSQSATEQTAGLNSELFNGKVDRDGSNATFAHIVDYYSSGTNWYRLYSDGWCEQGGRTATQAHSGITINLLKPFGNTNYTITESTQSLSTSAYSTNISDITNSTFKITSNYNGSTSTGIVAWIACGYIT